MGNRAREEAAHYSNHDDGHHRPSGIFLQRPLASCRADERRQSDAPTEPPAWVADIDEWAMRQERLRALGELTLGIAHDMNNVLGALSWRLTLLENEAALDSQQGRNLQAMRKIVRACIASVDRVRAIGLSQEGEAEPVDLCEVIAESVAIAQSCFRAGTDGRGRIHVVPLLSELPKVSGSAGDLQHVFINLLLNARDAMPDGGTITIRAFPQGERVVVTVEDEGTGIPTSCLSRIFEPFFTTKRANGSGIGLAMARDTMTRSGGSIGARNRLEGGACFELAFRVST